MYLRTAYNYTRLKRLEFSLALMCKKVCFKNDKTAIRRSVAHRAYTLNATVNGGVVVELYTICYILRNISTMPLNYAHFIVPKRQLMCFIINQHWLG